MKLGVASILAVSFQVNSGLSFQEEAGLEASAVIFRRSKTLECAIEEAEKTFCKAPVARATAIKSLTIWSWLASN